jgi:hypothetical protein
MNVVVQQGAQAGREFVLERGLLTMGRASDCDWVLPEGQASRYHAELRRYGDQWLIVDLGSTNGTFVGGVQLRPQTARPISAGEVVAIGQTQFALRKDPQADVLGSRADDQMPATVMPAAATGPAMAWLSRAIVIAGAAGLAVGTLIDWIQIEVRLPLLGTVLDRTWGGMDTSQGWLFLGVAAVVLVLVLIDVALRRWGMAVGLGQALLGAGAVAAAALSYYRYYQAGAQKLFGISLVDVLAEYARNLIQVSVKMGLYLVAAGLVLVILGGLGRLVVASLSPAGSRLSGEVR